MFIRSPEICCACCSDIIDQETIFIGQWVWLWLQKNNKKDKKERMKMERKNKNLEISSSLLKYNLSSLLAVQ